MNFQSLGLGQGVSLLALQLRKGLGVCLETRLVKVQDLEFNANSLSCRAMVPLDFWNEQFSSKSGGKVGWPGVQSLGAGSSYKLPSCFPHTQLQQMIRTNN